MTKFANGQNEAARLAALQQFGLVDSEPDAEFQTIARRAAAACAAPMALVSFVTGDRQWIKAAVGVDLRETTREVSFCTWAVYNAEVFCVEDAALDDRFRDNPLVLQEPHIRYYAGAPVATPEGFILGTVCVLDHQPRAVQPHHISTLQACAQEVAAVLTRRVRDRVPPGVAA